MPKPKKVVWPTRIERRSWSRCLICTDLVERVWKSGGKPSGTNLLQNLLQWAPFRSQQICDFKGPSKLHELVARHVSQRPPSSPPSSKHDSNKVLLVDTSTILAAQGDDQLDGKVKSQAFHPTSTRPATAAEPFGGIPKGWRDSGLEMGNFTLKSVGKKPQEWWNSKNTKIKRVPQKHPSWPFFGGGSNNLDPQKRNCEIM